MAKVKLTKGEMKKQRDSLKQFRRYLPTLQLKKQQLQMKILETRKIMDDRKNVLVQKEEGLSDWIGLLADQNIDLAPLITPTNIEVDKLNIAGANVPVFINIHFPVPEYDLFTTSFWVDHGLEELRILISLYAELEVIKRQLEILKKELRITTQRVNLFEKIKIPECKENIRTIGIYLGDQQANAVGIGKVAKKKVLEREEAFELEEVGV